MLEKQKKRLHYLVSYLIEEAKTQGRVPAFSTPSETYEDLIREFQGLCNERMAINPSQKFIEIQDEFLTEWNRERPLVTVDDIKEIYPQIRLWQGDITQLSVDAIVNAANSKLLGCTLANHTCIDNTIHTRAGVQLRIECRRIIEKIGRKEDVGKAKITKGYNLPAKHVIHTVGPIVDDKGLTPLHKSLLKSCYLSCLECADEANLSSIAFCCISTGEFHFPNEEASKIAVSTVVDYLQETKSKLEVIFNVYSNKDRLIYEKELKKLK